MIAVLLIIAMILGVLSLFVTQYFRPLMVAALVLVIIAALVGVL